MLLYTISAFLSLVLLKRCTSSLFFPISSVDTKALSNFQYGNVYLNNHMPERGGAGNKQILIRIMIMLYRKDIS